MQIALTKKLAAAMGVKPVPADITALPIFSWTANWINTFDRRKEDLVVMVNHATRFTVTIYGVKQKQFKNITAIMTAAIRNTLAEMNLNHEAIDEYLRQAGELKFVANHDRKQTAIVNSHGRDACFYVGKTVNESVETIKFEDTLGHVLSRRTVNYSKRIDDSFVPAKKMIEALAELTGKPAYKYRAFELLVTLDLELYKAMRRLIVPADIGFPELHRVLQRVFDWKNRHLHDFVVLDDQLENIVARLVMSKADLDYISDATLETKHRLSDFFPKHKHMLYTYDMGDNWKHEVELVRIIDEHNEESPYLLEAEGQSPPEDVGGVPGFAEFREIMLNESHPEHAQTKEWVRFWSPELLEWDKKPKVIHC